MKPYETVIQISYVGPDDPRFEECKPDIQGFIPANTGIMRTPIWMSWWDVYDAVTVHPHNPDNWSIIQSPLGRATIEMPFEEVKEKILKAREESKDYQVAFHQRIMEPQILVLRDLIEEIRDK